MFLQHFLHIFFLSFFMQGRVSETFGLKESSKNVLFLARHVNFFERNCTRSVIWKLSAMEGDFWI